MFEFENVSPMLSSDMNPADAGQVVQVCDADISAQAATEADSNTNARNIIIINSLKNFQNIKRIDFCYLSGYICFS